MTNETKPQTLTLNKEFKHAYYQGKSKATPFFVCYMVRGQAGKVRYGITTSKKIGNAVKRNHVKRLLRECARRLLPDCPQNYSYLFIARSSSADAGYAQLYASMSRLLAKSAEQKQK